MEIFANVNDTIPVGETIARIGKEGDVSPSSDDATKSEPEKIDPKLIETQTADKETIEKKDPDIESVEEEPIESTEPSGRFYSPLVKSIANKEGVTLKELDSISGSGQNGRVNKYDILTFLKVRTKPSLDAKSDVESTIAMSDMVEPMSRMRKKIADHMVYSVHTSPHVYTTVEADVTNLVNIRSEHKDSYKNRFGISLTYTPMILDN